MKLRIHLSGSDLYSGQIEGIPPIGAKVRFVTQGYCKGYHAGSILELTVTDDQPPEIDLTEGVATLILDANGFQLIREGQGPEVDRP